MSFYLIDQSEALANSWSHSKQSVSHTVPLILLSSFSTSTIQLKLRIYQIPIAICHIHRPHNELKATARFAARVQGLINSTAAPKTKKKYKNLAQHALKTCPGAQTIIAKRLGGSHALLLTMPAIQLASAGNPFRARQLHVVTL